MIQTIHGWRKNMIDNLQSDRGMSFEDAKRFAFDKEFIDLTNEEIAMCSPNYMKIKPWFKKEQLNGKSA